MKEKGLKCSIEKSFFGKITIEYLGFWVTSDRITPADKKMQAMKNMKPPTYQKEVHQFVGVLNYYRGIWARRSHTLAPLTNITSRKVKFK